MASNLWLVHPNGRVQHHSSYDWGQHDQMRAAFDQLKGAGHYPMMRPAAEDQKAVQAMVNRHRRDEVSGRERRGEGANPHPVERYGLERPSAQPEMVWHAYAEAGADSHLRDEYETWRNYTHPHVVEPTHRLLTGQQWVSGTHVERSAARMRGGSSPIAAREPAVTKPTIYEHEDGSHWVLDGHHRIAVGRVTGRPVAARLIHHDTVDWLSDPDRD